MHAYLLALEIEPVEVNRVYVALPLHCTLMPWFTSDHTPAEVLKAIADIAYTQPPVELISGPNDLFGLEKDVPVNLILNKEPVHELHMKLYEALKSLGIEDIQSQWIGPDYVPHVTRQSSGRFEEGRKHIARKLYLVEALVPDELQQKKIISKIFLGKNS